MSRNFELLQNLGKEQDIFEADREAAMAMPSPAPVAPMAPVELTPLQLKMDESQRDELAKVVQRLFLVPGADAAHMVVVAATESGSGCTWTCARMAEMLASQISASVCVVDANLTAPGLHAQFQTENFRGLADALREAESIRKFAGQVSRENLWLVSSGADSAGWQNLLSSDRMRIRLAELRREFDYVLIDAPALNTANHGIVLGHAADGVVLVIKANSSRREIARKAVQELENAQVRILGAVLNQRSFPIPQGIYNKL
jgi:capsular exopolysaccharide synthesis family protein